ncbi:MAG: ADP-ribosylglycohydrolase family protein, partial [Clostridia bacterium]|nr:ADP-ribosylglycohydrolase family protein [Clostridia bacterium]
LTEELKFNKKLQPKYANIHNWESYSSELNVEYQQSIEQGLDISQYKDVFSAVSRLPKGEIKEKLGEVLFGVVEEADTVKGYKYVEPSDIDEIRAQRKPFEVDGAVEKGSFRDKLMGAWMGRICGCLLGKTVEGIHTDELVPFLKESGNYPMHRYILHSDIENGACDKYKFRFASRCYADKVDGMPVDDDTNYVVLAQLIVDKFGRDFTPYDVSRAWLMYQPKDAYCTAERVAFCNFVKGYEPPDSAVYKNPYREWIGAQIRGDYFGYINPGNPELAADMAFRDASISHIKNGIYGEMWVAAMLACAAKTGDIESIIRGGLAQIPEKSRLYEAVNQVLDAWRNGLSEGKCFGMIHSQWNEYTGHGWCHTISNAMVVAAALLYGKGDYGRTVCMAVETGFDTDCNGATVGSVLGMAKGIGSIADCWTAPIKDKLHTTIFEVGTVKISDRVEMTLKHVEFPTSV